MKTFFSAQTQEIHLVRAITFFCGGRQTKDDAEQALVQSLNEGESPKPIKMFKITIEEVDLG